MNQLAKQYHPDTNKSAGAAEKFQEISEAYEVCFVVIVFSQFQKIVLYLSAPRPSPPMKETTVHEVELGTLSMDLSSDYTLY